MLSCLSAEFVAPNFMPTFTGSDGHTPQVVGRSRDSIPLPDGAKGDTGTSSPGVPGMALVPPKLVQKILRGEFIDMHELLPETWRAEESFFSAQARSDN